MVQGGGGWVGGAGKGGGDKGTSGAQMRHVFPRAGTSEHSVQETYGLLTPLTQGTCMSNSWFSREILTLLFY